MNGPFSALAARGILSMHTSFDPVLSCEAVLASPGAQGWPAANLALFVPFYVVVPMWLRRFWYISGNATGNIDIGIYRADGSLIVSTGATAQGTTNVLNFIDATDTLLRPGQKFLAMSCASASAGPFARIVNAEEQGVCQMAAAHALPATATFARAGQQYIPYFGFSTLAADL
jgi:hypothetical protein